MFHGFVESQLLKLSQRYARQSGIEQREIEAADKVAAKHGKSIPREADSFAAIHARSQALNYILLLGRTVYPDMGPPEPMDTLYMAEISERVVTHRIIGRVPGPEDDPTGDRRDPRGT